MPKEAAVTWSYVEGNLRVSRKMLQKIEQTILRKFRFPLPKPVYDSSGTILTWSLVIYGPAWDEGFKQHSCVNRTWLDKWRLRVYLYAMLEECVQVFGHRAVKISQDQLVEYFTDRVPYLGKDLFDLFVQFWRSYYEPIKESW